MPFETTIGGVVIRGRIDAVFADDDGGWTVIDWKTGDPPRDESAAAVQLAAYRLAWAELAGAPVAAVRAAFHYVRRTGPRRRSTCSAPTSCASWWTPSRSLRAEPADRGPRTAEPVRARPGCPRRYGV